MKTPTLLILASLLLFTACEEPSGPPPAPVPIPAARHLRIDGNGDPIAPIKLRWWALDARFELGVASYRLHVLDATGETVLGAKTTEPAYEIPAGLLTAGAGYTVEVRIVADGRTGPPGTLAFVPGADMDADGVPDAVERHLALTFAPELRFNHHVPEGTSHQNRTELFFPASVAHYDEMLHSEYVTVADPVAGTVSEIRNPHLGRPTLEADGELGVPLGRLGGGGTEAIRYTKAGAELWKAADLLSALTIDGAPFSALGDGEARIGSVPAYLIGQKPGTAPTYVHVYLRKKAPHVEEYGIEYWVFYPYDYAGPFTSYHVEIGSHRSDWEHTTFVVRRHLDAAGEESHLELVAGYYYGHGSAVHVEPGDLHLVEGTHPRVYISFGKHASYPAPGVYPLHAVIHDDVFRGNGAVVRTWKAGLIHLGEKTKPLPGCEWLGYRGRWGPDHNSVGLGSSATGPATKGSWGKTESTVAWTELRKKLLLAPVPD